MLGQIAALTRLVTDWDSLSGWQRAEAGAVVTVPFLLKGIQILRGGAGGATTATNTATRIGDEVITAGDDAFSHGYVYPPAHPGAGPSRIDFVGTVVPEEIGLTWGLGDRLREWNARYRAVIPVDISDRACGPMSDLIDELDEEGLRLAAEIAATLSGAKVRYYSEGRLRYVQ